MTSSEVAQDVKFRNLIDPTGLATVSKVLNLDKYLLRSLALYCIVIFVCALYVFEL
jgi:hypothetical protein